MEIYLVRHTTPDISKGICYGQTDILLANCFPSEVDQLRSLIPSGIDKVYSSPLIRCNKLASTLFPNEEIIIDHRLMEMSFGDWELKEWSTIDPVKLKLWMKDFITIRPANGENLLELNERVQNFMADLNAENKYKKVLIITHVGVIRCIVSSILEIDLSNIFKIKIDCGSVSKVKLNDKNVVVGYLNRTVNIEKL